MKKRSMLALASLATGFVVAAVTPSHAAERPTPEGLNVKDAVGAVGRLVGEQGLTMDRSASKPTKPKH
ncbi:hypothetical protein ACF061_22960 [Streptomyces sp. NPDC015220]|uniref:hypothetical protein n=1 Tax=Streptomyces sp. NPDC015220 TaxID=3364947 RepID=UPI0036FFF933